jgi:hypothetical protein
MFTLQIEYRVCNFDAWKQAFDNYKPFQAEDYVRWLTDKTFRLAVETAATRTKSAFADYRNP